MYRSIVPLRNNSVRHSMAICDKIFGKFVCVVVGTDIIAIDINE